MAVRMALHRRDRSRPVGPNQQLRSARAPELAPAGVLPQLRRRHVATVVRESPERADDLLIVVLPTVARFDSLLALESVVWSFLRQLPERFPHVRVNVVIEEGWETSGVARGLTKFVRGSDKAFTVITTSG